jgi:uncharacterized protein
MKMNGWRESVMAYVRAEAQPVDKYGHMPRLYALAATLGQGMDYDDDILFAAAWLHDLGVFVGHRPQNPEELARWDHVPYTVSRVRELLPGWGFPASKLDAVAEAIQTHQVQDDPGRIEATLLRDADILEQLGAVGLLRAVAKVGRDSRYPTFSSVLQILRVAVNTFPEKLHLNQSRSLAEPRVAILRQVISHLESEAGSLLF